MTRVSTITLSDAAHRHTAQRLGVNREKVHRWVLNEMRQRVSGVLAVDRRNDTAYVLTPRAVLQIRERRGAIEVLDAYDRDYVGVLQEKNQRRRREQEEALLAREAGPEEPEQEQETMVEEQEAPRDAQEPLAAPPQAAAPPVALTFPLPRTLEELEALPAEQFALVPDGHIARLLGERESSEAADSLAPQHERAIAAPNMHEHHRQYSGESVRAGWDVGRPTRFFADKAQHYQALGYRRCAQCWAKHGNEDAAWHPYTDFSRGRGQCAACRQAGQGTGQRGRARTRAVGGYAPPPYYAWDGTGESLHALVQQLETMTHEAVAHDRLAEAVVPEEMVSGDHQHALTAQEGVALVPAALAVPEKPLTPPSDGDNTMLFQAAYPAPPDHPGLPGSGGDSMRLDYLFGTVILAKRRRATGEHEIALILDPERMDAMALDWLRYRASRSWENDAYE